MGNPLQLDPLADATGTIRRLRALIAMGQPPIPIACHLSITEEQLWVLLGGSRNTVPRSTADAAAELFESLWDLRVDSPLADQMREVARHQGWVGPLAWDDIDDPHEAPNTRGLTPEAESPGGSSKGAPAPHIDEIALECALRGEPVKLTRPERLIAITHLHALKQNDKVIARTLHIHDKTVLRARRLLGLEANDPTHPGEAASV